MRYTTLRGGKGAWKDVKDRVKNRVNSSVNDGAGGRVGDEVA